MKKLFFILSILVSFISFCSCSEQDGENEYDNWKLRSEHYIDSIAKLANSGIDGWTKMVAFNYVDSIERANNNSMHFIYIQKLEKGEGTSYPLYKDSVRVHYLGRLIPSASYAQGYVFGKTYNTYTLNEQTDVPTLLGVNGNVPGFTTALLNMVEGDRWKIVIPAEIGYNAEEKTGIPSYSTLIFDIKLARIYKYKIDTNTAWH